MKRSLALLSIVAMHLLLTSTVAFAQATAQLNGRVTDQSGAVLPGVTVTATQTDTGFVRSVVTDASGTYLMPNLPTGPYKLEVALQGFRTYVQTGIVLQVGGTPTINAALAVGSLEETVSVEAAAPLVDVRSAGISEVVEQERILELPLQGRNVTDLILLAGAAVPVATAGPKNMPGSVGIGIAGGLQTGVAFLLDGAMHNNPYDNYNMPLPFPDALQEFSVATSALNAQSGTHAGGSVNAVTKAGTNNYHGNVFEFLRDKRFNAKAAFAPIGPNGKKFDDGLKRNQPGGTLGGPIVRDKIFFFGGYQGTFLRVTPADAVTKVPTAAMLAGDFTAFASPECNRGRQITLRAPFVNNRIDPALYSPAAMAIAKRLPVTTDPCGDIRFSAPQNSDLGQVVGRLDYQQGANHSIFGRYMFTWDNKAPGWPDSGNVLTTRPEDTAQDHQAHSLTVGDTIVFGTNTVNSLRVAWNRSNAGYHLEPFFGAEDVGIKNFYNYVPHIMGLSVNGAFTTASGGSVLGQFDTDAYQVGNDITMVRGTHQMGVGANVAFWDSYSLDGQRGGGVWMFNGSVTGLGLSDFLTGRVAQLGHARPGELPLKQWHIGLYAQDTWKAGSRVTLNGGLRWEPFLGQNLTNGAVYTFNLDNYRKGVKSKVYLNAPAGLSYPGDAGFSGKTGINKQWANLSPRVGLAWDLTGDGRTALRSSYSLAYDFMQAAYLWYTATASPFSNRIQYSFPGGGFDNPYRDWPGTPPHPVPAVLGPDAYFPDFGVYGAVDPDINSSRVQSWNVVVERQLGSVWQVSASYLGSYADRLWGQIQLNPGVFLGLGPCTLNGVFYPTCTTDANLDQRRLLVMENPKATPPLGAIDRHDDVGTQTYRALKLSFQRRAATGVRLSSNYTWSRCIGSNVTATFNMLGSGFLDPNNPSFDDGHCTQDRTHLGNATVSADTPRFANTPLRIVASDWRVSGILTARSGSWLTVTTARDIAATGIANQRPNQVKDDPYGNKTLTNYLNPAAFALPAPGTLGSHKRASIEGPGFWSIDLALSRLVTLSGAQNLEVRLEIFNMLNNFNWGTPVVNFDSGTFGQIQTQGGDPRILQFGVKYGF